MTDRLTPLLAARPWLLADGATGSNLFHCGLQSGDAPELWNSEHPERIAELARAFIEADEPEDLLFGRFRWLGWLRWFGCGNHGRSDGGRGGDSRSNICRAGFRDRSHRWGRGRCYGRWSGVQRGDNLG